jgi:hypothetical protein
MGKKAPSPEYTEVKNRLANLASRINELERDFEKDLWDTLGDKIKKDANFAQAAYASLCNVDWENEDGSKYSISWRGAGGLISQIRKEGDYLSWYCSGNEGHVNDELEDAMKSLGWTAKSAPIKL